MDINNLVKPAVKNMEAYIVEKEEQNAIKLDANENPYMLFNTIRDTFIKNLGDINFNRYPDTDSVLLREKFSAYVNVKPENIMCTNGSDEAIHIISTTFLSEGDKILIHDPTFSMYGVFANFLGSDIISVGSKTPFEIDVDEIISISKKENPKLVYLCNPNNPTGAIVSRETIIKIVSNLDCMVIIDEAYYEFYGESVCDLIEKYENLIVLRTLSKAFSMASIRVGFSISCKKVTDILYKVKSPYNLNSLSQQMACIMLDNTELIQKSVTQIKENKDWLIAEITKIGECKIFPTAANFVFIKTPLINNIVCSLKESNIMVRTYSGNLVDCLRISVGTKEENLALINAIKAGVK